jgi:hypothetical protein
MALAGADDEEPEYKTRKGYLLKDLGRSFIQSLTEKSAAASGKLLHYTADFICSGGLPLWERILFDYAFDHIGIASPRIFLYLTKRFKELEALSAKLPFEAFCKTEMVQRLSAEIVLVVQSCPQKTKIRPPPVHYESHENEDWLIANLKASEKEAVLKVYNGSKDQPVMYHVANEMVDAIIAGATEKALFWARWLLEEDAIIKKKFSTGLSTADRGPATLANKQRQAVGYYICSVLAEVYKELAEKKQVRMHEEYQTLLDLYRSTDGSLPGKHKMNCLILMIQILCEIPRWRVPAAPSLVGDPLVLQRATAAASQFYKEILVYPMPMKVMPKTVGSLTVKRTKPTDSKSEKLNNQLEAMDDLLMKMYGGF